MAFFPLKDLELRLNPHILVEYTPKYEIAWVNLELDNLFRGWKILAF